MGVGGGGGWRDPKRGARREGEIPRDFGPGEGEITGGEISRTPAFLTRYWVNILRD